MKKKKPDSGPFQKEISNKIIGEQFRGKKKEKKSSGDSLIAKNFCMAKKKKFLANFAVEIIRWKVETSLWKFWLRDKSAEKCRLNSA